jgi:transposase
MGTRKKREREGDLFILASDLVGGPGNAFYDRLNGILDAHGFDRNVEGLCAKYYKGPLGHPSIAPGVYFRSLLLGYFEGIGFERAIAWRLGDSLSARRFIGYGLTEATPDHSTISRTRRLYSVETHKAVFRWVLGILAEEGLVKGKTVGVDATTLESWQPNDGSMPRCRQPSKANAAMRNLVRRDDGRSYGEYLTDLAKAEGIESPTREQLARLDRKRKKKTSNKEWESPADPDARVAKMKDGSTHLAHKVEHAVDLSSGALLSVTVQGADLGDTTTMRKTLAQAEDPKSEVHLGESRRWWPTRATTAERRCWT